MSGNLASQRPESGRRSMNFVAIWGYSLFRRMRRRPNPARKAVYRLSLVCDRVASWNGWWRGRAQERLHWPCKSCRNPPEAGSLGGGGFCPGMLRPCFVGLGNRSEARFWFSARPLFRKRAGRSSNACVVRVCRPPGPGSTSGFPRGFIAAGKWRRKWGEASACFFGRSRRDGNRSGPTYDCWSRRGLEARGKPGGCISKCCIAGAAWEAAPRRGRSTMPRVLCVWFPRWPIQRLRIARPELRRSELVLFAGQNQRPFDHRLQRESRTPGRAHRSTAGRGQGAVAQSRLPSRRCRRRPCCTLSTCDRISVLLPSGRSGREC